MSTWTTANIPDLSEQIVVVTGATSGIGLWTAHGLAARGANVVLAVRNMARGQTAASEIRTAHPHARLSVAELDVSRLGSIAEFATRLAGDLPRLDVLVNNAGLGLQPVRSVTADTFETQFATNYLGPFALTARLIPLLLKAPAPRVVMVSSGAHKRGRIHFDDLQAERSYSGIAVYSQSKLADLMFTLELARRCQEQGSRLASLAAHPGLSRTNFIKATALPRPVQAIMNGLFKVLGQDSQAGAWPSLYAAAMPDAVNGDYWGPGGFLELRGKPVRVKPAPRALDRAAWRQLWQVSEELTGVRFPALT
jgi:NAD(P)-dependent dehydrogenase (short-subunit alcohol dehydrogenase family)